MPNMFRVGVSETGYQQWDGYPQSPFGPAYPNQIIYTYKSYISQYDAIYLVASAGKIGQEMNYLTWDGSHVLAWAIWNGSTWVVQGYGFTGVYTRWDLQVPAPVWHEASSDIYSDSGYSTVLFAKTTTPAQDAGIIKTAVRIGETKNVTVVAKDVLMIKPVVFPTSALTVTPIFEEVTP